MVQAVEARISQAQLSYFVPLRSRWNSGGTHNTFSPSSPDFSEDLRFIRELRERSRRAGVRVKDSRAEGKLQHDHVYDVFTLYKVQKDHNDVAELKAYMQSQLKATVLEQYEAFRNTVRYDVCDGKLYSAELKNRPIIEAFYRGAQVLGSTREKREAQLMENIEQIAASSDTPIGTMAVAFSPHDNTGKYSDEVMHIFQVHEDVPNQRYLTVDRIRLNDVLPEFSVGKGNPEREEKIQDAYLTLGKHFDPAYGEDKPNDMSFADYAVGRDIVLAVGNRFGKTPTEILKKVLNILPDQSEQIAEYLQFAAPAILHYISILCNADFGQSSGYGWRRLAEAFNDLNDVYKRYVQALRLSQQSSLRVQYVDTLAGNRFGYSSAVFMNDSRQQERRAAGCGFVSSLEIDGEEGGFGVKGVKSQGNFWNKKENKSESSSGGTISGICPGCGQEVTAVIEDCKIICPTSGCEYSREGRSGGSSSQVQEQPQGTQAPLEVKSDKKVISPTVSKSIKQERREIKERVQQYEQPTQKAA